MTRRGSVQLGMATTALAKLFASGDLPIVPTHGTQARTNSNWMAHDVIAD